MTHREARCLFTRLFAELIREANARGYECAAGEIERDPRVAVLNAKAGTGISKSLHLLGLAGDLHLYRQGRYVTSADHHLGLGKWWKEQHEYCRWGGDIKKLRDANHYSVNPFGDGRI